MKSREYETSPSEVRTFAFLQLGLTAVFLTLLFFAFGGTGPSLPPWWLIAVLLGVVAITAVLAERVWLTATPMDPGGDPHEMQEEAVGIFAGQIVRKLAYCEAGVIFAVVVGFVTSYGGWPMLIGGVPGLALLAFETWPSLRNTSMTAAMLDAEGADSGLVEAFPVVVTADVSARLAWPDDAASIARVQLAAWRDLYADVLSPEVLESLDVDEVAERWSTSLTKPPDARIRVLVALDRTEVRGFALVHPSYDPDADQVTDGEVGEFVVDPAHRGEGHGSRLLQAAMDTLAADKFTRVRWWIASTDDKLREFVTSSGWEADGAHRELQDDAGHTVKQVRLHSTPAA